MAYAVENGMWRSVFAVPTELVDAQLKLCGEAPLKVFLALLRYNGGRPVPLRDTVAETQGAAR